MPSRRGAEADRRDADADAELPDVSSALMAGAPCALGGQHQRIAAAANVGAPLLPGPGDGGRAARLGADGWEQRARRAAEDTDAAVGWQVRRGPGRGAYAAVCQRPVRLAARTLRPAGLAGARAGAAQGRAAVWRRVATDAHRA